MAKIFICKFRHWKGKEEFYFRWLENSIIEIEIAASSSLMFNHLNWNSSKGQGSFRIGRNWSELSHFMRTVYFEGGSGPLKYALWYQIYLVCSRLKRKFKQNRAYMSHDIYNKTSLVFEYPQTKYSKWVRMRRGLFGLPGQPWFSSLLAANTLSIS